MCVVVMQRVCACVCVCVCVDNDGDDREVRRLRG